MKSAEIVTQYGTMWPRNPENIQSVQGRGAGVYILFDGSMPMYIGKGQIGRRIKRAARSPRRKEMWDHFSWYAITKPELIHDIEVLMLRMLPPTLRSLTQQGGNFICKRSPVKPDKNNLLADHITRKIGRKSQHQPC